MKLSLSILFLTLLLVFGCTVSQVQPSSSQEESTIFNPENATLIGFWKIEQRFLWDESKSDWVETTAPREIYKEFIEWCGGTRKGFLESVGEPSDSPEAVAIAAHPPVSIMPSPALPLGFVPNGVCYLHRVEEVPGEGKISSLMEMSLQGVAFTEEGNAILIKEPEHSYSFSQKGLELITSYFEKEGDTIQKPAKTILIPATQEEAEQVGWPYTNK